MPKFKYVAMDARGRETTGEIEAESQTAAIGKIREKGLFVTNVVDWMTGSADLVSLRARESVLRKLDEVSDEQAGGIKAANYAAAPLLLVLVGLLVYFVRRHRR